MHANLSNIKEAANNTSPPTTALTPVKPSGSPRPARGVAPSPGRTLRGVKAHAAAAASARAGAATTTTTRAPASSATTTTTTKARQPSQKDAADSLRRQGTVAAARAIAAAALDPPNATPPAKGSQLKQTNERAAVHAHAKAAGVRAAERTTVPSKPTRPSKPATDTTFVDKSVAFVRHVRRQEAPVVTS